jgi:hypothetical protein
MFGDHSWNWWRGMPSIPRPSENPRGPVAVDYFFSSTFERKLSVCKVHVLRTVTTTFVQRTLRRAQKVTALDAPLLRLLRLRKDG